MAGPRALAGLMAVPVNWEPACQHLSNQPVADSKPGACSDICAMDLGEVPRVFSAGNNVYVDRQ